jgi:hypothetical protein
LFGCCQALFTLKFAIIMNKIINRGTLKNQKFRLRMSKKNNTICPKNQNETEHKSSYVLRIVLKPGQPRKENQRCVRKLNMRVLGGMGAAYLGATMIPASCMIGEGQCVLPCAICL